MASYISIGLLMSILLLAMISRLNFSKYKNKNDEKKDVLSCMARMVAFYIPESVKAVLRRQIRRVYVLNERPLYEQTENFLNGLIKKIFVFGLLLCLFALLVDQIFKSNQQNDDIVRPDVGGNSEKVKIHMEDEEEGAEEVYDLEIGPREYTDEEFETAAADAVKYIERIYLKDNTSENRIVSDLELPDKDELGRLRIIWESSDPLLLSSSGAIQNKQKEDTEVKLKATIKDNNHSVSVSYNLKVVGEDSLSSFERTKLKMQEIENETRSDSEVVLPDYMEGIRIERVQKNYTKLNIELFVLGLFMIAAYVVVQINRLKDEGKKRDSELRGAYYGFVNRLTIHLGAGSVLREAFRLAGVRERSDYLKKEITLTLKKIESGIPEYKAYTEMGKSIGTQEYLKLMSLVSQNLEYGNKNLISLLETEVNSSIYIRKEEIRKRGEQASEKLLIPTSILMILVIAIVIYPAYIGL